MKELLICNIIALIVIGIFATILFIWYINADEKLAKYNESKLFDKKERK